MLIVLVDFFLLALVSANIQCLGEKMSIFFWNHNSLCSNELFLFFFGKCKAQGELWDLWGKFPDTGSIFLYFYEKKLLCKCMRGREKARRKVFCKIFGVLFENGQCPFLKIDPFSAKKTFRLSFRSSFQ